MLTTGLMVFLGVALIVEKLRRQPMLKALRRDMALDLPVSLLDLSIHGGIFSGVTAATKIFGYIDGKNYVPGRRRGNDPLKKARVDYSRSGHEKGLASRQALEDSGSPTRARTWDLRINSPSLYQLSYQGTERRVS